MIDRNRKQFRSIVLDVDSTLCGIEGIDWLAERRDASVAKRVAEETALAMRGELTIDAVYAERLSLVAPTRDEVGLLAQVYYASIAPDAESVINKWIYNGISVSLVTGGFRQAIAPVAAKLGIVPDRLHAMDIYFNDAGHYSGYDTRSPLSTMNGKREVVEALDLPRPVLMVGDGMTDLSAKPVVDAFAAYTGFAERPGVTSQADFVVASFRELDAIVSADG